MKPGSPATTLAFAETIACMPKKHSTRFQDNLQLTERYDTLIENISYARCLQTHFFKSAETITQHVKDCFVLDLPKDIVSGDFGWFCKKEDRVYTVVGDCTGHGISAAMISLLITNFLNDYIREKNQSIPSLILKAMNNYIYSLRQGPGDPGMMSLDIAVCCIDLKQKKILFSGSNRPLYLNREGELFIINPSKFYMGSLHLDQNIFTENSLPYCDNDSIYLCSDGYCDQFGGTFNKKILKKKLKNLLLNLAGKPMSEQKEGLENFFHLWKGGMEQTDDVYVMGIRL